MNNRLIHILLLLLGPFSLAWAQSVDEIKSLVEQNRAQEAYQRALAMRSQHEGEAGFDLYYGIAAIDSGHVSEGVYALERVVYTNPDALRARLELGRGYFLLGDYSLARPQFEYVLRQKPPQTVIANIQRYLAAIRVRESRYQTTASFYIDMATGYDSNINGAPTDAFLDHSIPIQLGEGGTRQSDGFAELMAGGQIVKPSTSRSSHYLRLNALTHNHFSHSEYDNSLASAQLGLRWSAKEKNRFGLELLGQRYNIDGEVHRDMYGTSLEWTHQAKRWLKHTTYVSLVGYKYPNNSLRDSTQVTLGYNQLLIPHNGSRSQRRWKPVSYGGFYISKETAESDSDDARAVAERDILGLRLGAQMALSASTTGKVSLTYQRSEYAARYFAGLLPERKEDYFSFDFGVSKVLTNRWIFKFDYSENQNVSNINLFTNERRQVVLGVRYDY